MQLDNTRSDIMTRKYNNSGQIRRELNANWSTLYKEQPGYGKGGKKITTNPKKEAMRCAKLYVNASAEELPFVVLGETSIREDGGLLRNLGTISTEPVYSGKKMKEYLSSACPSETPKKIKEMVHRHLTRGAVLNEGSWFILPNDMFMLGVVHSGKECHIATRRGRIPSPEVLWDHNKNIPRVLGREILQISNAGYKLLENSQNGKGLVFVRTDKNKALETDLTKLREAVINADLEKILSVFKDTISQKQLEAVAT